jgi:putative FmdB family regulatory protein
MPLFEYRCRRCGHTFEAFVTATRQAACPACQGRELDKLVSSPGRIGGRSPAGGPIRFGGG